MMAGRPPQRPCFYAACGMGVRVSGSVPSRRFVVSLVLLLLLLLVTSIRGIEPSAATGVQQASYTPRAPLLSPARC